MSTEIAVRTSQDVAALDELDSILLGGDMNVEVVDDPRELSSQIVAQLLAAESDDELEQFGEAEGWRGYAVPLSVAKSGKGGTPFRILGFTWRPSSFDEGAPVFFVVQAENLSSGERVVLTTGSLNVLAQLSNLARRGRLPGAVRMLVEKDSQTKAGFKPLWLITPPGVSNDEEADN